MQTYESLIKTRDYNYWANNEFLIFLQKAVEPDSQAVRVFAHLLVAEITWLRRMREGNVDNTNFNFWAGETVGDCAQMFEQSMEIGASIFKNLSEEKLDALFAYKNSKGVAFENTWREALTHVFMHSGYHRGQMAQSIRASGEAPPSTDFIRYLRIV